MNINTNTQHSYMTNNIQDKCLDHFKPQATIFMQRNKLSTEYERNNRNNYNKGK